MRTLGLIALGVALTVSLGAKAEEPITVGVAEVDYQDSSGELKDQQAAHASARGFADAALFEVGPNFRDDEPGGQWTAVTGLVAPHLPKHWGKGAGDLRITSR